MIAACKLCGQLVTGRAFGPSVKFSLTSEDAETQRELQEFDLLGHAFTQHILMHHKVQAQELTAVSNLSMKVYAMRQAQRSDEPHFEALRGAWSETIRLAVFGAPQALADAAPSSGGESSSSSPAPAPSGS